MLPTSHGVPTNPVIASPELLAEAFSEFITASARLELSYRDLQAEVQQLSRELAERNAALSDSLAENRSMRESLEQILDSMPCGVMVLDGAGDISLANPEASRLLALSPTQLTSLDAVRAERGIDLAFNLNAAGEDPAEQELALTTPAGERWLAVRRRAIDHPPASSTHPRSSVLILRDVSARRRIEAERDAARSALALAEVSAILAHEIRNPLASMELFAGLIADCPERSADWVTHLIAGIRALSGTVNNVLTLHGGAPLVLERLDLRRELDAVIDFLQPQAMQAEITVTAAPLPHPAMLIRANRSALHQILLNLCTNAFRHTPAGGTVTLSTERLPHAVAVVVEDTGCGMPALPLTQLFHDRFSGSGSSSGLGLAVCGRLMRQHGGEIRVTSRPGRGSTFTLEFPQ